MQPNDLKLFSNLYQNLSLFTNNIPTGTSDVTWHEDMKYTFVHAHYNTCRIHATVFVGLRHRFSFPCTIQWKCDIAYGNFARAVRCWECLLRQPTGHGPHQNYDKKINNKITVHKTSLEQLKNKSKWNINTCHYWRRSEEHTSELQSR